MLSRTVRSLALAACVAAGLAGCVKVKQRTVVMPDGSGKLTFTIGMSKGLTSLASAGAKKDAAKDPFGDIAKVPDDCNGFVAFTRPEKSERDGFTFLTFTGYFEDANQVRMGSPKVGDVKVGGSKVGGRAAEMTLQFRKEGDGYVLTVDNGVLGGNEKLGDLNRDEPDMPSEAKEMMKKMLAPMIEGLEIAESYELPGSVTVADGLAGKEGRVASTSLTAADLLDEKKAKELEGLKGTKRRIVCGVSTVSDDEMKAFRAEMAQAKVEFAKWKAEEAAKKAGAEESAPVPAPAGK